MRIINLNRFRGPYGCKEPHIYVGRTMGGKYSRTGSLLANPYKLSRNATAEDIRESLTKYRRYLWLSIKQSPAFLRLFKEINEDSTLACWCTDLEGEAVFTTMPEQCHAQIVAKAWRWLRSKS